jgi:branched-chain amino acid transport system ATP-binding protein
MKLLEVARLSATYADGVRVLHDVALEVGEGEFVTLIGANGAGKTTTLRAIMGLVRRSADTLRFADRDISRMSTSSIARLGLAMVPEGRGVLPGLTVLDNLRVAATPWRKYGQSLETELAEVYDLFPILAERKRQLAWSLSGGQQQMLAIGRALMARPKLMLLDEPSLGLAPNLVDQMFETLQRINARGVAILLVEQNAFMALEVSTRGYVLDRGAVIMAESSRTLEADDRVRSTYLGI